VRLRENKTFRGRSRGLRLTLLDPLLCVYRGGFPSAIQASRWLHRQDSPIRLLIRAKFFQVLHEYVSKESVPNLTCQRRAKIGSIFFARLLFIWHVALYVVFAPLQ
jgi:hypothetical protein